MLTYAITDRKISSPDATDDPLNLLRLTAKWRDEGISFVQLREKDLGSGELVNLAREMLRILRGSKTRLLVNHRLDVAVAAGVDGIHLTSHPGELSPTQVRVLMPGATVSVSCHTVAEVDRAREGAADLILFAPVFEKQIRRETVMPGNGLKLLREACHHAGQVPVLALGGVDRQNAHQCKEAGAAGIAGIRLFHKDFETDQSPGEG